MSGLAEDSETFFFLDGTYILPSCSIGEFVGIGSIGEYGPLLRKSFLVSVFLMT